MKQVALAFLLTGTVWGSMAWAGGREPALMPPPAPSPYRDLSAAKGAKFDRLFMGWMGSYLEVSQSLANSSVHGGKNPVVKAFAAEAKATHSAARNKLKSWGGGQFGIFCMAGPPNGDYDTWFLSSLPRQNEQLRQLLRLVPSHTHNANLRQFAAQLLPRLNAEDARARALLDTLK